MKSTLALLLTLFAFTATASVIPNVNGMAGRLETLTCESGAGVALMSETAALYAKAEESCKLIPEPGFTNCLMQAIAKLTKKANVVFHGNAIPGTKDFQMVILHGASSLPLFSSLREGHHMDLNNNGIALAFTRKGVTDDEFTIESSALSPDGNSVGMLMVPVRKRLVRDQVYFFFNCRLRWVY